MKTKTLNHSTSILPAYFKKATFLSGLLMLTFSYCHAQNPVAKFSVSDSVICANDCVVFTNLSTNDTAWQWYFQGGLQLSSTDQNPMVCYLTTGNFDVTLIASKGNNTDTLTLHNYIKVNATPPVPVITQSYDTLFCSFDTSYIAYQWYGDSLLIPGATNTYLVVTNPGNYDIQVANQSGCNIAVGINYIGGSGCSASFTINADTSQLHHYIVANNATGVPPIHYYWSWGDSTHDTIPYPTHTYADSGFYTICLSVTDSTGCYSIFCDSAFHAMRTTNYMVSMTVVAPKPNGIQPMSLQTSLLSIYPNPATSGLTILSSSVPEGESVMIRIINILGETVQAHKLKWNNYFVINIRNLPVGMYFLQIQSERSDIVRRFVKE